MTGKAALDELVENGWFSLRSDGWYFVSRAPAKSDIERYVYLIHKLGAYTVPLNGKEAPIRVTRGDGPDSLIWKVADKEIPMWVGPDYPKVT